MVQAKDGHRIAQVQCSLKVTDFPPWTGGSLTRVLVLGQAFKGSLAAGDVTTALRRGAERAGATVIELTGSDGGDGLLDALGPRLIRTSTASASDPLGRPVTAPIGWFDPATAVIESRTVCGLSLLSDRERDPLLTSTRGVGEVILAAEHDGAKRIHVGLGGSSTMDGGLGMARAWGWVPRDAANQPLAEGGDALQTLATLEAGSSLRAEVIGLYDVRNALLGDDGARVYAAQKGAGPEAEALLHEGLQRLVAVTQQSELAGQTGAGAAGGLGFGLLSFARGRLQPGAAWVLSQIGFDDALLRVNGLVVSEGAFDRTSLQGKLTGEAMRRAADRKVPVALVAPHASGVPDGIVVESGAGLWDLATVSARSERAVRSLLKLPGSA